MADLAKVGEFFIAYDYNLAQKTSEVLLCHKETDDFLTYIAKNRANLMEYTGGGGLFRGHPTGYYADNSLVNKTHEWAKKREKKQALSRCIIERIRLIHKIYILVEVTGLPLYPLIEAAQKQIRLPY